MRRLCHTPVPLWAWPAVIAFWLIEVVPAGAEAPAPDPAKRITQYVHDVWQTENGLPANDVQAIVHARDGFLWLATRGGLVRFDGVSFRVFDSNGVQLTGWSINCE